MIYIHVPFCHRKCTYCAFYSKPVATAPLPDYVSALIAEMSLRRQEQNHPIKTVYFGGGTPSILPVDELARIVEALRKNFDLSQLEEVTIEANPEDLTPDYLHALSSLHFFNRISIGVQSLDDSMLRLIGRRHTAAQALAAIENAHAAGFQNISVDFIYGLPTNSHLSPFTFHLSPLITHLSAYALTVEPGTALAVQIGQGRVTLPDEDEVVRQYHALCRRLQADSFHQYEISNFARPGYESKHNSRYWNRTPYLGLGPAAHSFDGTHRLWNISDIKAYCNLLNAPDTHTVPTALYQQETLTPADAYNELLMTSLRTARGLSLSQVPEEYRERLHRQMQPYIDCGWIEFSRLAYRPTEEGLLHADGIAAALFLS